MYVGGMRIKLLIPDEDYVQLKKVAAEEDRTAAFVVRRAISEHLNNLAAKAAS